MPFAPIGAGAVGAKVIPTFDAVTVTVAVFETVFVAESTALIEIGVADEGGARYVASLASGPHVSSPRAVIAGPHWVPVVTPPRYQVTAGDGALEVAVKTIMSPPGCWCWWA